MIRFFVGVALGALIIFAMAADQETVQATPAFVVSHRRVVALPEQVKAEPVKAEPKSEIKKVVTVPKQVGPSLSQAEAYEAFASSMDEADIELAGGPVRKALKAIVTPGKKCCEDCICKGDCNCQFPGQCLLMWAQQNGTLSGGALPNNQVVVDDYRRGGHVRRTYTPKKVEMPSGKVIETDEYITGTFKLERRDGTEGWVRHVFERAGSLPRRTVQAAANVLAPQERMIEAPMCVGGNCNGGSCANGSCGRQPSYSYRRGR
jgi:hypothetical protein